VFALSLSELYLEIVIDCMAAIKVGTFNVRGLNEKKKRTDVFSWLKKRNLDICLIQETHSTKAMESFWEAEWGYECYLNSYDGKSRGIGILFKNSFSFVINKVVADPSGRFLILNMMLNESNVTIANVYGPNEDDPVFYQGFNPFSACTRHCRV
jgi:exonuclease III